MNTKAVTLSQKQFYVKAATPHLSFHPVNMITTLDNDIVDKYTFSLALKLWPTYTLFIL